MNEEVLLLETRESIVLFINNIGYGSKPLRCINKDLNLFIENSIKTFNYLFGKGTIYMKPLAESEWNGREYIDIEIPECYRIYNTSRDSFQKITMEDVIINYDAISVAETGVSKSFKMDVSRYKVAANAAKEYGVKFTNDENGMYSFSSPKKISLLDQIENKILEGAHKLEFDTKKYNINTMRAYCSTLVAKTGINIKCSVAPGWITLTIGSQPPKEAFTEKLKELISEFENQLSNEELSAAVLQAVPVELKAAVNIGVIPDDEEELPIYKEYGYDTQEEYDDYLEGIAKAAEEWQEDEGIDTEPEDDDF